MKRIFWVVLVLVILALVYFTNYRDKMLFSGLVIGIKLERYPADHNLTILQGESETTRMFMENLRNEELIFVNFYYEKPSGINITAVPEYTVLEPKSRVPIVLRFTVGEDVENKTYCINVWAKSEPDANDKFFESEKCPIYVTVLYNPYIIRPTTTSVSTTTSTTTTLLEQKNNGIVLKEENLLIFIILAFMLMALIVIPYFTFKESHEDKEISPKIKT